MGNPSKPLGSALIAHPAIGVSMEKVRAKERPNFPIDIVRTASVNLASPDIRGLGWLRALGWGSCRIWERLVGCSGPMWGCDRLTKCGICDDDGAITAARMCPLCTLSWHSKCLALVTDEWARLGYFASQKYQSIVKPRNDFFTLDGHVGTACPLELPAQLTICPACQTLFPGKLEAMLHSARE
eukprot:8076909-Pyramimonas_sp.AAC.1